MREGKGKAWVGNAPQKCQIGELNNTTMGSVLGPSKESEILQRSEYNGLLCGEAFLLAHKKAKLWAIE